MIAKKPLVILSAAFLVIATLQGQAAPAFVQASRAALRSKPITTAPILDFLPTNTEVDVLETTNDWCRVRTRISKIEGFIACRLLAERPLTLEAIEAELKKPGVASRERLDWESRAFWIAPSLTRFETVGLLMEYVFRRFEDESPRPRNAEFDAMKQRLSQPTVVSSTRPPMIRIDPLTVRPTPLEVADTPLREAIKRAALPSIRPSYFHEGEPLYPIALRPFTVRGSGEIAVALIDALSHEHRVAFRTRRWEPAWSAHFGWAGAWDVGRVEVLFDREVTVHGITGQGAPTGFTIASLVAPLGTQACVGSRIDIKGRPVNTGWRESIVAWVGKAPPQTRAAVTTRQVNGPDKYKKLVIELVDLDGDSVPEFSLWAGLEPAVISTETYWKAVFANVGGTWLLLAFNQEADCT
jgi:hypothetical protein